MIKIHTTRTSTTRQVVDVINSFPIGTIFTVLDVQELLPAGIRAANNIKTLIRAGMLEPVGKMRHGMTVVMRYKLIDYGDYEKEIKAVVVKRKGESAFYCEGIKGVWCDLFIKPYQIPANVKVRVHKGLV